MLRSTLAKFNPGSLVVRKMDAKRQFYRRTNALSDKRLALARE
jgi:hypothetical protein